MLFYIVKGMEHRHDIQTSKSKRKEWYIYIKKKLNTEGGIKPTQPNKQSGATANLKKNGGKKYE